MHSHRFFEGGELPSVYTVNGNVICFDTDFRCWLKYEYLLSADVSDEDKVRQCIEATIASIPHGIDGADLVRAMHWFYSCADIERLEKLDIPKNIVRKMEERPRTSSLYWDFWHVGASFKQQHNIDLYAVESLHWWEFKRLLGELKPGTPFVALQHLRGLTEHDFKEQKGKTTAFKSARAAREWSDTKVEQLYRGIPGSENTSDADEWS